jgi:hypothetical protein
VLCIGFGLVLNNRLLVRQKRQQVKLERVNDLADKDQEAHDRQVLVQR